jgi:hypothetical protein
MSLCITYGMDFSQYLRAAGIDSSRQGSRSLISRNTHHLRVTRLSLRNPTTSEALSCPVPWSLVEAFIEVLVPSGDPGRIEYFSFSESGACLNAPAGLLVDRGSTVIEHGRWLAEWQRPIYLIRHRSGRYQHGFCTITNGWLTIHPRSRGGSPVSTFPFMDVEVVGRVIAEVKTFRVE